MSIQLDKLLEAGCSSDAKHKVCRSRGGESCAFDGAAIVLAPIADAAHVIHGPSVCVGNAWEGRGVHSTAGDFHRRGFSTDVGELDIVYGGEKKLSQTVREVVAREHPNAVFVYATCVTGLIGEDLDTVCRELSSELWLPVIPVHSPGFVGPKNLGNRIAGETLLEHVIGTAEPTVSTPFDITLVGEYNVAGDLDLIEPLLRECGIRILSHVTGNARFEEIRYAHRAKLTVVTCSRALINIAAGIQKAFGVPYLELSFFGATEIARSIRAIADALEAASPEAAAAGLRARADAVIARNKAQVAEQLAPYAPTLAEQRCVLYSGGVKSWSMASALVDLGIEILAVGTKKSSVEDEEKVRAILGPDVPLLEDTSPAVIRRFFAEQGATLLVAGGRNRYLAAKEGWPFVDVNQERETAYAGYEGLVNLAKDLSASIGFYARQRTIDASCATPQALTPVREKDHTGTLDALKNATSLGAALAFQGVDRAIPVLHAAQGCTFLGKVLALRHYNDPIALGTTKLFTEDVVMGSDDAAAKALRSIDAASKPDLIGLVAGGLAEVKGDDTDATAAKLDAELSAKVIAVHAADFTGGLEEGYLAAVQSLLTLAEPAADGATPSLSRVTVLASAALSPADVRELRDIVESFGLVPTIVPDLSALDGSRQGLSALAVGGTTLAEIAEIGSAGHTLVIGGSLEPAARTLSERFGTPYTVIDAPTGLAGTDALVAALTLLSGEAPSPALERDRAVLVDAMRDAHLRISGARVTLALEPDHAASIAAILDEMAARPIRAVVPVAAAIARRIAADEVVVGDFASVPADIDLLVSGSHGRRTAAQLGVAHYETGFPRFEVFGASRQVTLGYRGATAVVDAIANLLGPSHGYAAAGAPTHTHDIREAATPSGAPAATEGSER